MIAGATLPITRTRHPVAPPTRRACEAAVRLGMTLDERAMSPAPPPARFDLPFAEGSIVLLRGPSGSGKSTLLRDICLAAGRIICQ